jgi:threonine synthase
VSLGEGATPLYSSEAVARYVGLRDFALKHEGMNPTGSFKDRGMTVAVTQAKRAGATNVVCASTGNTSASLAAYAASARLACLIVVPDGATAIGKLSQALAYGARTVAVRGDFDAAMRMVRELAREGSVYLCNSLNPFRLEGQKTIVLELCAQRDWLAPDWIVLPAGNLGNTAAFGKAFLEAHQLGLIDRLPRLAAIQAAGAAPFLAAFERGFDRLEPVVPDTLATAIRIGDPVSFKRAVSSIKGCRGVVAQVSDADILDAKAVVDAAGIGAEPASCASVAGARRLVAGGVIQPSEDVVCLLTGHVLKDPETTVRYHRGEVVGHIAARANRILVIDPDISKLRDIARGSLAFAGDDGEKLSS